MKTSADGIYLMHKYESCKLTAYKCPAGIWSIGYGETGPHVTEGMVITQEQADSLFEMRLASEFEPGVMRLLGETKVLQCQFDALVCFAYNVGISALRESTLLRMLKSGNVEGTADQFLRWDKAAGKRMLGLYRRRVSERALFLGASGADAFAEGQRIKAIP